MSDATPYFSTPGGAAATDSDKGDHFCLGQGSQASPVKWRLARAAPTSPDYESFVASLVAETETGTDCGDMENNPDNLYRVKMLGIK